MSSRSRELRARDRRVFRVSLGIAVVLHAAALGFIAWSRTTPKWTTERETVRLQDDSWTGTPIDVFFGPPKIYESDGTLSEEPAGRVLEAARLLQMPPECLERSIVPSAPGFGEVRLAVNASGRVDSLSLDQSTGDACWDLVAMRVAGDLWYRWLPNDRFPAPLELLQPVTVGLSQY